MEMKNESRRDKIENLKRLIWSMERDIDFARREMRALVRSEEDMKCEVEISWNAEEKIYVTRFSKNGECLYVRKNRHHERQGAKLGIESVDGQKVRIPWKEIDAGIPWRVTAVLSSFMWERHIRTDLSPSKLIHLDAYRA